MRDSSKEKQEVRSRKSEAGRIKGKSLLLLSISCFLASFFILASGACPLSSVFSAEPPSPYAIEMLAGRSAPDFTLNAIDGKSITLSSYKQQVVILTFWAAWCPPCKEELQSLARLNERYKNRGLIILGVSSDKSISDVRDFISKNRINFPILFDENLYVSRELYKVFMVPTTFVIDRRGIIFKKHFGEQDWTKPEIIKEIEALL